MTVLLFVLLCAAALSNGCGTARAIVDERDPDIIVESIAPTSGMSGQQVTFEAKCCQDSALPKPLLVWDFGLAAHPQMSFDEMPTVTLRNGSATPYDASLRLVGGCLGANVEMTVPFRINIAPISILQVTGTTGHVGDTGSFVAVIGTGVVKRMAWDFGSAGTPSGSNSPNPQIVFTDTPGTYTGTLTASNDFEAATVQFTITVLP